MATAKDIRVAPISAATANALVRSIHYSGKVATTSQIHLGCWVGGELHGAMQFGTPIHKSAMVPLVEGTAWNGMIELNRLAFGDALPRNSESRALGFALRLLARTYAHLEWVVSFADGTQCGDGAIYRAVGFWLTQIRANSTMWRLPSGEVVADIVSRIPGTSDEWKRRVGFRTGEPWSVFAKRVGAVRLPGFQLRYIYPLRPGVRERLTCPILPYSAIAEVGAEMYKGQKIKRSKQAMAGTTGTAEGQHLPGRSMKTDNGS